jgi:Asp-tRNA(Asn)/Glu-tRNA(Gln) amidotransferase A subunit family amidase
MPDQPWQGDACSLVDAFRAGERSPSEELEASIAAIDASQLNAFSYLDVARARESARTADVGKPFGGVATAIKELDAVEGWPATEASLAFADRRWDFTNTQTERLRDAGAVLIGQTTASEFGGLNISISKLHGITRNPWNLEKTTGGSSAGSSAAVAGGLVPIATGGDGGGSIRIPAGFCGLFGMKGTFGRIPKGPHTSIGPLTVLMGCMARSVRDAARWYDVCAGYDAHDPYSLPKVPGWEAGLGHRGEALRGRTAVIAPNLGRAILRPEVEALIQQQGELLAKDAGLELKDIPVEMPDVGTEWVLSNMITLRQELGDRWPACKDDLTAAIGFGITMAETTYNLDIAASAEGARQRLNERMADIFDRVDFIIAATNPDVAFGADVHLNTKVGDLTVGAENNGVLTIPANVTGVPAVSIPAGTVDGLPVGLQIITRHHDDALLFELASIAERERPWPLVAPGSPR